MQYFVALGLLISTCAFGQPVEELFYMNYIDSLVANELTAVRTYENENGTESYQVMHGYYYNDQLVAIQTLRKGELADFNRCTYYLKNGALFSSSMHDCRTNQYEILDLALYSEANRDSLGKVDYSKLPTNCMTVKLFCQSEKMTREIEGLDVFDPLEPFSERRRSDHEQCKQLLAELDNYSKL